MVSIGQQAFFGLGGYAMLALGNFAGVNPFIAVPLGALAAGVIAVPCRTLRFVCRAVTSRSAPGSLPSVQAVVREPECGRGGRAPA